MNLLIYAERRRNRQKLYFKNTEGTERGPSERERGRMKRGVWKNNYRGRDSAVPNGKRAKERERKKEESDRERWECISLRRRRRVYTRSVEIAVKFAWGSDSQLIAFGSAEVCFSGGTKSLR